MYRFKTKIEDIFIVIPAKDESPYIGDLLKRIISLGFKTIVVVNDSSNDHTNTIARSFPNVVVLDHLVNLGAGASTQTGITYAVNNNAQIIATIDADLQHNPENLIDLILHLEKNECQLVVGSRFLKENNIPASRIFYNKLANVISFFLTGKYLSDSQSGLKALHIDLARSMNLNYDGFEFCMEIIKHANISSAKIAEIPVDVVYTTETTKKGQNLMSGIRIVSRLLSPFN